MSTSMLHRLCIPNSPLLHNPTKLTHKTNSRTGVVMCRALTNPGNALNNPHPALFTLSRILAASAAVSKVLTKPARALAEKMCGNRTPQELTALEALKGNLVCSAGPLFFAAINTRATGPINTPLTVVASGMAKWLELYSGVLMVRVLLSWFPNIPWDRQPLSAIRDMCDPYLNLFRNIIPPFFNALDLSPLLAFLVLGALTSILNNSMGSM